MRRALSFTAILAFASLPGFSIAGDLKKLLCEGRTELVMIISPSKRQLLSSDPVTILLNPDTGDAQAELTLSSKRLSDGFRFDNSTEILSYTARLSEERYSYDGTITLDRETGILRLNERYHFKPDASKDAVSVGTYRCRVVENRLF